MQAVRTRITLRGVALSVIGLPLASCDEGVLTPHGPIGGAELTILFDATAIMLAVVIPVILLTLAFAWWFRAGNARARYLPDWEYSGRIEFIVWSIPALVILFLGGIAWISSHDLDPPRAIEAATAPLEIEVVSLDWKWLFIYPDARHRQRQPARRARWRAGALPPDLGQRHEQLLRAAARQPDLHHGRHDHAAQPAGGSSPGPTRASRRSSAATASPTCASRWPPLPADQFRELGRGRQGTRAERSMPAAYATLARPSEAVVPATYASVADGLFEAISGRSGKRPTNRRTRSIDMLGKLTWAAIPFDQPIIVGTVTVIGLVGASDRRPRHSARAGGPICGANGSPASTTSASASCTSSSGS